MKRVGFSLLGVMLLLSACASTPPRVLSVRSYPAEADVCLKGRQGSEFLSSEKQCVGKTPFEATSVEVVDAKGMKKKVNFNELQKSGEHFHVILSRDGFVSRSEMVPSWEHNMTLKEEPKPEPIAVAPIPVVKAEQKTGSIQIKSSPAGALVYINDTLRGNTPFSYEGPAGMAKVKIEYPNHDSYEGIMSVVADESHELNLVLQKKVEPTVQTAQNEALRP